MIVIKEEIFLIAVEEKISHFNYKDIFHNIAYILQMSILILFIWKMKLLVDHEIPIFLKSRLENLMKINKNGT